LMSGKRRKRVKDPELEAPRDLALRAEPRRSSGRGESESDIAIAIAVE
jgi:hypothetical protein